MHVKYLLSSFLPLLQAAFVSGAPSPPGVAFLYNANITVGLTVDVGAIPAGNVSVIPVIGGALIGPKFSGAYRSRPAFFKQGRQEIEADSLFTRQDIGHRCRLGVVNGSGVLLL
jgi:hypothetical protein